MEKTFTIKLADGTLLENLGLNGNNYISGNALTEEDFEGKLDEVEITSSEGDVTTLTDAFLVQVEKYDKEYWFILAEKTAEQKLMDELEAQAEAIVELAGIIGGDE